MDFFLEGIGLSPSESFCDPPALDNQDPLVAEIMQPFYKPEQTGRALCIRPDVCEWDELQAFPEFSK